MKSKQVKIGLVGCGAMGKHHANILKQLSEFDLTAVCDVNTKNAEEVAKDTKAVIYADYNEMFKKGGIDAVTIVTRSATHADITLAAADAGLKGICCEKPMAVNLKDARRMTEGCNKKGIPLIINHQRRLGKDLITARSLIEEGAIGNVYLIKGQNPGDIISDGTHAIDSLLFLAGDSEPEWVFGQINWEAPKDSKPYTDKSGREVIPGMRYGHPVEKGAAGFFQLKNGVRCEILCGDMIETCRAYQDYEIFGSKGRIWRCGDMLDKLFIQDEKGGEYSAGYDEKCYPYKPVLNKEKGRGTWRPVEFQNLDSELYSRFNLLAPMAISYNKFADVIRNGGEHPLSAAKKLMGFEIFTGIYESARLNKKLQFPIEQERFPLEIMVEEKSSK